jgi:hypothetical protein
MKVKFLTKLKQSLFAGNDGNLLSPLCSERNSSIIIIGAIILFTIGLVVGVLLARKGK